MRNKIQVLLIAALVLAMGSIVFTTDLVAGTITSRRQAGNGVRPRLGLVESFLALLMMSSLPTARP